MATAQPTQNKAKARQSARSREAERRSDTEELSGERDEHYNLISVLYHGLQGADQCALYAEDAEEAGDDKLAEFLRSAGETQANVAKRAKQLLLQRLASSGGGGRNTASEDEDDDIDDDDDVG
jgi:hypothetical protein